MFAGRPGFGPRPLAAGLAFGVFAASPFATGALPYAALGVPRFGCGLTDVLFDGLFAAIAPDTIAGFCPAGIELFIPL